MIALVSAGVAVARDQISHDPSVLPVAAQQMLKKYFPKSKVNHIKIDDKVLGGKEYDVVLDNGTEVEFDKDGSYKEVDCGRMGVPDQLILRPIREYVSRNFKGVKVVTIEKKRNGYELELLDGRDLYFDRAGNFIKVDD